MKDIPNYEGHYAITEDGQVWSYKTHKFLKPTISGKRPYYHLDLYKNGISETVDIHILVAKTYIPNPENKPTVDHIDKNPLNNNVNNLKWATQAEQNKNKNYSSKENKNANSKKNAKPIEQRDKKNHLKLIAIYPSACEASRQLFNGDETKNSLISKCANGTRSSAYGYWWCFTK